ANANSPNVSTPRPPATAPSACQSSSSSCVLDPPSSSSQQPKNEPTSPPLSWTCHKEIRSRFPAWGRAQQLSHLIYSIKEKDEIVSYSQIDRIRERERAGSLASLAIS
ncbi:hypothetical protein KUCAC02_003982, partial [Chaenocephalus aceratus]